MRRFLIFSLLSCLLILSGCVDQEVAAPPQGMGRNNVSDPATARDLQSPPQGKKRAGADVAVTAWTALPAIVQPGDTLTLRATIANLGSAKASGPIVVRVGILDTNLELTRMTLACLEAGGARSGTLDITVPVTRLFAVSPPGVATLYCTHDFDDYNPANDYRLAAVELAAGLPVGDLVELAAGSFSMGSPPEELGREGDEIPHPVTLTRGILIQATEVSNRQFTGLAQWALDHGYCTVNDDKVYDALDGSGSLLLEIGCPACEISFDGQRFQVDAGREDHPVGNVTWFGAAAYCDWLNLRTGLPPVYDHFDWNCHGGDVYGAAGYRLPTEAEWEYACRAGSVTAFANGEITDIGTDDPVLNEIGWYLGNSGGWTHPVAQLIPNAWGLFDMHGNVAEWCNDYYGALNVGETDPVGPASGLTKVMRGGSYGLAARWCRSADRSFGYPNSGSGGFRVARTITW